MHFALLWRIFTVSLMVHFFVRVCPFLDLGPGCRPERLQLSPFIVGTAM